MSFLDVIAHDETETRLVSRKAAVVSDLRASERYAKFITKAKTNAEVDARLSMVSEELDGIVRVACEEVGHSNWEGIRDIVVSNLRAKAPSFTPRTASIHSARRPRLCPFHKDVVDISLTSEDPRAGYDAMAQHWGGPRHCEGDGYEGSKCNFKPQMTTQAFWNEREEQRAERKRLRDEQQQLVDEGLVDVPVEIEEPVGDDNSDDLDREVTEPIDEGAEIIPFSTQEPSAVGEGISDGEPLLVAASFHEALIKEAPGNKHLPGASPKRNRQYEHIKEQCLEDGKSEERCKEEAARTVNKQRAEHGETKKSADNEVGLGGPSPKIDKRKWTPETVKAIDADDDDGQWPTRRKDIIEPIVAENADSLKEIGEATTERVDVEKKHNFERGPHTQTFPKGDQATPVTSALEDNPIKELLDNDFEGFVPEAQVQAALSLYRS